MALKDWRKANSNNYGKGRTIILNINPKYKVNKIVGYKITLYDFSKSHRISKVGRLLKVTKTRPQATKWVKAYMRTH